jgi:putative proteasome-type protease
MRSNLSVGMPIDLVQYDKDQLKLNHRRRFDQGDPEFAALSKDWSEGVRTVFKGLPDVRW